MNRRRTALVRLLTVAPPVIVVIAAVVFAQAAPMLAKRKLIAAVRGNCGGCEFEIDRVSVRLLSRELVAEGVRYHGNPADPVEVSFEFDRLEGHISLLPLWRQTWAFTDVLAVKPTFQVIEKDPKPPSAPSPESFPRNLPPLTIGALSVSGGRFTYIHRVHAQDAVIQISQVEGTAKNFSSRAGLGSSQTKFEVSSQLERSGTCEIHADFDLFAARNDDHIDIDLRNQRLREMDPYFSKNDGVRVDGVLDRATATMTIRHGMLTGELVARYHDLVVRYYPTDDRGSVGAFFNEALQKLLIQKTQTPQGRPSARFQVARQPDQSIIKFMLSGLKPAAHEILTNHGDKSRGTH